MAKLHQNSAALIWTFWDSVAFFVCLEEGWRKISFYEKILIAIFDILHFYLSQNLLVALKCRIKTTFWINVQVHTLKLFFCLEEISLKRKIKSVGSTDVLFLYVICSNMVVAICIILGYFSYLSISCLALENSSGKF